EAVLVEELGDAGGGGQRQVVLALGADVEAALDLLAENGGLALRTADPQPFRYATLRSAGGRHRRGSSRRAGARSLRYQNRMREMRQAHPLQRVGFTCLQSAPALRTASPRRTPGTPRRLSRRASFSCRSRILPRLRPSRRR